MATAATLGLDIIPSVRGIGAEIENQVVRQVQEIGNKAAEALSTSVSKGGEQGAQNAGRAITEEVTKAGQRAGQQAGEQLALFASNGGKRAGQEAGDQLALFAASGAKRAGTEAGQAIAQGTVSGATEGAARAGEAISQDVSEGARSAGSRIRTALTEALSTAGREGASFMSRAMAEVRTSFGTVTESARSVGTTVDEESSKAGSSLREKLNSPLTLGNSLMAAFGVNAVQAMGQAAFAAVKTGIQFDASQESATMAFTTMLHSATQARDFMGQLEQFAAETPFDLPDVVTGAQRLMAFGFAAQDVVPTLTAIGDAVAGMGGSAEQIQQVTLAIGQMSAKGKVQGDEILQLTEAGIPALRILANQMHVSTDELSNMITKGMVPASEAIPRLLQGMEQGTKGAAGETTAFAGMMDNQAKTLTGVWSNFKDNFNHAMGQLVQPAMPAIKASVGWLTDELGKIPAGLHEVGVAAGEIGAGFRTGQAQSAGFAGVMERIGVATRNVGDWFMTVLWPPLERIGILLWQQIQPAWTAFVTVLTEHVWPALMRIWTAASPLIEIFLQIAGVILGVAIVAVSKLVTVLLDLAGPVLDVVSRLFAGWLSVIRSVFTGVIDAAVGAWHGVQAAFDAIVGAVHAVGDAFDSAVTWIEHVWDRLKAAVAGPINFVLVTILDDGLFAAWNWIADKIGLGDLKLHVNPVPGYARGGVLPGYSPGVDNMLALSPGGPVALAGGEAIMRPEWTLAAGRSYIDGANQASIQGGVTGAADYIAANGLPGMFLGGIFDWVGDAANAVGNFASSAFNGVMRLGGEVVDFFKDPPGFATKVLNKIVDENSGFNGGTDWGKILLGLPRKAIGAMVDKVIAWWHDMTGGGGAGGAVDFTPGAGVSQWTSVVLQALSMMGQPGSLLNSVLRRMQQESGGNPNVVNQWDSNWQKGTPSVGLMQVIGPTYASNADPRSNVGPFSYGVSVDPLSNVLASMHYALGRYGSLSAAYDRAGGYDVGGLLPMGVSTVYNGTRRPEAVLTGPQWDDIHQLARRGAATAGPTVMVHARTDASPEHIAAVTTRRLQIAMRTG